jgi:hypothetical protein
MTRPRIGALDVHLDDVRLAIHCPPASPVLSVFIGKFRQTVESLDKLTPFGLTRAIDFGKSAQECIHLSSDVLEFEVILFGLWSRRSGTAFNGVQRLSMAAAEAIGVIELLEIERMKKRVKGSCVDGFQYSQ